MTRGIDAVLTLMGTQAPLYLLPSRIAYANLKHGTKRFDFPLQYESGNYKNTGVVPVSVKKKMSPLQQCQMEDKFKGIYMDVEKPSSTQTWWRSVA